MDIIRKSFEAVMASKGRGEMVRNGANYKNANIQTKWRYFQLGWNLSRGNA
jgi:hypothetical protein